MKSPQLFQQRAISGLGAPAYAYAASNPVKFGDRDGRDIFMYDDGFHWAVSFEVECSQKCEKDPVVVRMDYRCDADSMASCIFWQGNSQRTISPPGNLSDTTYPGEVVTRCEADCETTKRAMDATREYCSQPYSVLGHSCREAVKLAFSIAKCSTPFTPTSIP